MKKDLIEFIFSHPLHKDFFLQLDDKQISDIRKYVADFKHFCENKETPDLDNELWFKLVDEKVNNYICSLEYESFEHFDNKIVIDFNKYNPNLKLDETDLEDFIEEWERRRTGKMKFTDEKSRIYKTFRECWLYREYTYDENFLNTYKQAAHPLIQVTIGKAFINNGDRQGIGYIFNALTRAVVMPNPYWNTPKAILGYIEAIWEVLRLCCLAKIDGDEEGINDDKLKYKLIKLLFLYMTRSVEISPNEIQTADTYTNRAWLFYYFPNIMQILFANHEYPFVIPDLHFASDKYLSYSTAARLHPELVSGFYLQCLWDAQKMYKYGDLSRLNEDGGYSFIEDESFLEIVKRCIYRSKFVAQLIYNEDKKGNVYLTKKQIKNLFAHILFSDIDLSKDMRDLD